MTRRKTAHIDVRVEPELIRRIDAWCARQRMRPSRSAAIVYMLERYMDREGELPEIVKWFEAAED